MGAWVSVAICVITYLSQQLMLRCCLAKSCGCVSRSNCVEIVQSYCEIVYFFDLMHCYIWMYVVSVCMYECFLKGMLAYLPVSVTNSRFH